MYIDKYCTEINLFHYSFSDIDLMLISVSKATTTLRKISSVILLPGPYVLHCISRQFI